MSPEVVQLGPVIFLWLLASIVFIVFATAKWKLHPLLSILAACYLFGLGTNLIGMLAGLEQPIIADVSKELTGGFGSILTSIGLVIIFGTMIGKIIEKSGAAVKMAEVVLNTLGERHPALAMTIIGYIVSIPVFCDSGYVILSSLKKSLAKKTGVGMVTLAIALATGLFATHTLVPPTPGPIAAASNVGIGPDGLIWVILIGLLVAVPVAIAGYLWARRVGESLSESIEEAAESFEEYKARFGELPSAFASLAPIGVPIVLMALGSIANFPAGTDAAGNKLPLIGGFLGTVLTFIGTPVNALFVGLLFALFGLLKIRNEETLTKWIGEAVLDAAAILMITGAGGALGALIKATPIADYIKTLVGTEGAVVGVGGLIVAFLIAALLKTAQGSSTASLVITSTILFPILPAMGLDAMIGSVPIGQVLAVMAIGSGAMVVSHVNDSYFWVVSQFSGMSVTTAYKAQTMATLIQGLTGLVVTVILGFIFL